MAPTVSLLDIAPRRTDRAVFVGQTGSGKSTLAEYMLATRRYVVVYDPKGMIRWPRYTRYVTLENAMQSDKSHILYAPSFDELDDEDSVDAFFQWIYQRKNTTVYVDELMAISKGDVYPRHLGACLTRGRERGVETWCATQRPTRIPQVVLSESEHVYAFKLRLAGDRERVEQTAGIPQETIAALQKRQFVYAPQDGDVSSVMSLNISNRSQPTVSAARGVRA